MMLFQDQEKQLRKLNLQKLNNLISPHKTFFLLAYVNGAKKKD